MTTITISPTAYAAGFEFDLDRVWIDTYGARWTWTGETDEAGMALMQTGDDTPQTLSHVYWWSGPLIPEPRPVTHADRYAVLATPLCAEPDPSTPTPLTFAGLLGRLRGRSA